MQLRIVHTTGFAYDGKAVASYNQARLTPLTSPEQIVVHSRLEIAPAPWTYEYRDYFGNQVTSFEVLDPHETLQVTATSTVQTHRTPAPAPELSWDDLRGPEVCDRWTDYLVLPELVAPPADLVERLDHIVKSSAVPGYAARAVCELVREEVAHRPGSTAVTTPAAVAWSQRAGVAQDLVHLVLGALRTLGIPCRYVSGYVHTSPEPGIGETVRGDSHAWVEWWDDGWRDFDPTNGVEPSDRYVVLATGRDYADVKPLAGIYSGAQTLVMTTSVDVTRLA